MKIVRVIARLNVGGPAKHVVWLTQGLRDAGHETVLVAGTVPPGEDDMGYFASELGVEPTFIPEMSREISARDVSAIWKLYRLFVRERPDIVHTHTAKAGTAGRLAGFLYRWFTPAVLIGRPRSCRFVHTYHGHIFHGYYGERKTRAFLFIEKMLAKLATDRIVVLSEQQRREIHEAFGVGRADQFAVVPLGMDTSEFSGPTADHQALRNELRIGPDELLVGIVGRLTEIKNHELFLQAAAIFKNQPSGIKARFLIVGDGALRESLERQAVNLGLGSDVIFTGSRRDLKNVYQALDIVALTSRNEGTPLTLIEAMASGCAVLSTAVGGVVDLLGQPLEADGPITLCERGISVPPNDATAFAAGLKKLSGNAILRRELGERGLLFVQSNYSVQRLISDVQSLYADLLRDN